MDDLGSSVRIESASVIFRHRNRKKTEVLYERLAIEGHDFLEQLLENVVVFLEPIGSLSLHSKRGHVFVLEKGNR